MEKSRKHRRSRDSASIPLDLMIEIFAKLPAKSLMKFKCLSKQYATIIESQNFVDSFLSYSSNQRPRILLGVRTDKELVFYSATTHSNEEPSTSTTTTIPRHLMTIPERYLWVNRTIHGLILYSTRPNQHVICNLATRQLFHVPRNENWKEEDFNEYLFFGYEPISNRFKVISILTTKNRPEQQCWILTVGDGVLNSWRKIEDIPYLPGVFLEPMPLGTCINGVLYYNVRCNKVDDTRIVRLVSFDLKTEKFNLIKLPPGVNEAPGLFDFQGNIAFFVCFQDIYIRVWVLENADKHKWSSKKYKLPLTSLNLDLKKLEVLGICEGEIVFIQREAHPTSIFYFDLEKKTMRKVKIEMPPNSDWAYYSVNLIDNLVLL